MNQYSTNETERTVKVYPLLGRAAMAAGLGRAFRLWTALRGAKRDGIEHFSAEDAIAVFGQFGWSRRQWYDLLNHPQRALFAELGTDGRLYLNSLEKVCMALACRPGLPIWVSASAMRKQSTFQAQVYAAGFRRSRTVSRAHLQADYGIGRNTQRRYEAHTGVDRGANFVKAALDDFPDGLPIPEEAFTWSVIENGIEYAVWQVPNNYHCDNVVGARPGLAKHINRRIRRGGLFLDKVEARHRFLVDDMQGRRGDVVAVRTDDVFAFWRSSGFAEVGSVYQLTHVGVRQ